MRLTRVFAGMTAGVALAAGFAVATAGPTAAQAQEDRRGVDGRRSERLAAELKDVLIAQRYQDVLDRFPVTAGGSAAALRAPGAPERGYEHQPGEAPRSSLAAVAPAPIHQMPNVDLSVIELDSRGRPTAAADVILSPQYPDGKIVPLNRDMATDQVRWRRWDDATWDTNGAQGKVDAVPGRENAPIDFMSPYPASVLKLMVGFGVLQLVDRRELTLDEVYHYDPTGQPNKACGDKTDKTIRELFDEMITVSSNTSTCALIKLLHQRGAVDPLNAYFARVGLPMLQLIGTRTVDGGRWIDVQMGAMDTAKLLLIVNGGPGVLWRAPDGKPVKASELSAASRKFFLGKLHDQGLNQTLSTTNWCGRAYPAPGIPQRISSRWIDPVTGTVTVGARKYGQDVRPCQAAAEVTFAHKTGLVDTSANDAGIVRNLPGERRRHYIVVLHSNLGDRYIDVDRPADVPGTFAVPTTQKHGNLGRAIDRLVTAHRNH